MPRPPRVWESSSTFRRSLARSRRPGVCSRRAVPGRGPAVVSAVCSARRRDCGRPWRRGAGGSARQSGWNARLHPLGAPAERWRGDRSSGARALADCRARPGGEPSGVDARACGRRSRLHPDARARTLVRHLGGGTRVSLFYPARASRSARSRRRMARGRRRPCPRRRLPRRCRRACSEPRRLLERGGRVLSLAHGRHRAAPPERLSTFR